MSTDQDKFKKIVSHAKEYGFIFQSSEIYDGLSAVYDYAQNGVELKNNIKNYWWASMVQMNDNIVGLDSSILMHPTTWKASGHTDAFNDPLIDNKVSKKRYRADVLVEDYVSKIESKIEKEIEKEILKAQKEISELKKNSISSIQIISGSIVSNIIENISGDKLNESSIKATVEDVSKKNVNKFL